MLDKSIPIQATNIRQFKGYTVENNLSRIEGVVNLTKGATYVAVMQNNFIGIIRDDNLNELNVEVGNPAQQNNGIDFTLIAPIDHHCQVTFKKV